MNVALLSTFFRFLLVTCFAIVSIVNCHWFRRLFRCLLFRSDPVFLGSSFTPLLLLLVKRLSCQMTSRGLESFRVAASTSTDETTLLLDRSLPIVEASTLLRPVQPRSDGTEPLLARACRGTFLLVFRFVGMLVSVFIYLFTQPFLSFTARQICPAIANLFGTVGAEAAAEALVEHSEPEAGLALGVCLFYVHFFLLLRRLSFSTCCQSSFAEQILRMSVSVLLRMQ
jgi:hypothetical protein